MPPRLRELGTAYAEANGRSFSSLLEDLVRRHLESAGIEVNLPPEEFVKLFAEKGVKVDAKKRAGKKSEKGGTAEL